MLTQADQTVLVRILRHYKQQDQVKQQRWSAAALQEQNHNAGICPTLTVTVQEISLLTR